MSVASEMRDCLSRGDADGLVRLWASSAPHLSQPVGPGQAQFMLHRARTEADCLPLAQRLYSHAWLTERGFPSGLPDELRPKVERVSPIIIDAVGISVSARSQSAKPLAEAIRRAMSDAVVEMYADGVKDPVRVKARMMEAREKVKR